MKINSRKAFRLLVPICAAWLGTCACMGTCDAQSGLRESLQSLDRNNDGELHPKEITPQARPFLERVAKVKRMSLDRKYDIERWQEAAREYHAIQNGVSNDRIRPSSTSSIREFGPSKEEPIVPEFGLAEVKYSYTREDLEQVDETLKRYDRDGDGFIDRQEVRRGRWTHRDPMKEDYDLDDRLSRLELAQRYARRRLLDNASDELVRRDQIVRKKKNSENKLRERQSRALGRSRENHDLAGTVFRRFDLNRNRRLEESEAAEIGMQLSLVDANQDGEVSEPELLNHLAGLQQDFDSRSETVPEWFYELDSNDNNQIEMSEFAEQWNDEQIAEFESFDSNSDGILTINELDKAESLVGGQFLCREASILPPRKTVISEIEVVEDFIIGDLDLELHLSHTYTSYLDAYLTGPTGQRIELFTEIGRHDDHFDHTVFDDQANRSIAEGRPPFRGTFQPESVKATMPGLSAFNGSSIKGVWQLVIRCSRSDRFGMLHSWGLIAKPERSVALKEQ